MYKKRPIVIEDMKRIVHFTFFSLTPMYYFGIFLTACLTIGLLFSTCKSKPVPVAPPQPEPAAFLVFNTVEAETPEHLTLNFTLETENSFPSAGKVKIESWQAVLNGRKAGSGFEPDFPSGGIFPIKAAAPRTDGSGAPVQAAFPLGLKMDVAALAGQGLAPADNYDLNLIIELNFTFDSAPPVRVEVSGLASFPGIRPPVFNITSIAILKAELVNTRFRVGLKIDNPNPFPVDLSAFGYELYGNGRLWAEGMEKNILRVNKKSSLEGNLFLIMNFINMKRDLLDQIIRLEDVNYRFAGEAKVITGVEYLPSFTTSFNLSGYSKVYDN